MSQQEVVTGGELAEKLQQELEFKPDETGQWLQSDEMTKTDLLSVSREDLPTRVRVAANGVLLACGIRKVDIEGAFRLGQLEGDSPTDIDHIRTFWPPESRIQVDEDDTWLFMGRAIDPTPRGMEIEENAVEFALCLALQGAVKGTTRDEALKDDWLDGFVRTVERENDGNSYTGIFKAEPEVDIDEDEIDADEDEDYEGDNQAIEGHNADDWWDRRAENLRTYSIESDDTSLNRGHTTLRFGDRTGNGSLGWLIAHIGNKDVHISDSFHEKDPETGEDKWLHYGINLPIPENIEIKTVGDIAKLKTGTFTLSSFGGDSESKIYEFEVSVDHALILQSEGGELSLEFKEPMCTDCELPIWKFRQPTDEEWKTEDDPTELEVIRRGGYSSGGGVYSFNRGSHGNHEIYCYDCHKNEEQEFAEQYPLARRVNAVAAVRQALDEQGYPDVIILGSQVWPSWNQDSDTDLELELFTYVEYERDGMTIQRRTGKPILKLDGTLELNQKSREYIDLR